MRAAVKSIEEEQTLRDITHAQHLTQERMVELMGVEQESVSRMERRTDLLLSTLSSYVAAMGGKLRLMAEFPDRLTQRCRSLIDCLVWRVIRQIGFWACRA